MDVQARVRKSIRVNLEARAANAEQRRARTRERLLDAAEGLIAEKGVGAATIEEMVRAAGVSRGTFYNYFPTVTDLLAELNRRVAQRLEGRFEAVAQRAIDIPTRLAASLHMVLAAYSADPIRGWVALQIATSMAPRQRFFAERFERLFREGVASGDFRDVDVVAAMTVCFGAMRMTQLDRAAGDPDHSVEVVALVLAALGTPFETAREISRAEARAAYLR